MKKILSVFLILAMMAGLVSATTTRVGWSGSGSISARMTNVDSEAEVVGRTYGSGSYEGEFEANDNSYGRVEVKGLRATYDNGKYDLFQSNVLQSGANSRVMAWSDGTDEGFIDATTDTWRRGNSLKANGYGGHSWSWSGTDEQIVGAMNGAFDVGMYAGRDDNNNGTDDAYYGISLTGSDTGAIGTERAGSNTAMSARSVSGDTITRGTGSFVFTQEGSNTGSIENNFEWN